jgi:hypothetical protein
VWTKIISLIFINWVTHKLWAKHEPLFIKPASGEDIRLWTRVYIFQAGWWFWSGSGLRSTPQFRSWMRPVAKSTSVGSSVTPTATLSPYTWWKITTAPCQPIDRPPKNQSNHSLLRQRFPSARLRPGSEFTKLRVIFWPIFWTCRLIFKVETAF